MPTPVLHLMSGKIASGKSTLAKSLATELSALLLSEDHWLSKLYPDQIKSVTDYVRFSRQIRDVVGPLVTDVLGAGVTVVLDFPANTLQDRQWLRGLADAAGVAHCVHYIEVHDDVCRSRLHIRNRRADHEFAATDAEFDLITSYFQPLDKDEGLQIEIHRI
ncbi:MULTISPECIES: ATP-binding protein [unclassified Pseudomonas]|uniref:AAA family ATPase n=1 Tax=unclassified Pseudomonas TaxID=196821 RepID=UPI000A0BA712|nr:MULTISPECIES: ATP-binding protein [unclassified Pseudomonas]SMF35853.1 Predicted kinase [Pseudomonas sp. LAIL14HWK12:I11]SMR79015.1 Predicted kinase [Pseudomonas sp. LAIL14HWK12:I10]SOD04773.1 Predicted kinase [Pseudomonas sp. LAIL14HWK12:I8]